MLVMSGSKPPLQPRPSRAARPNNGRWQREESVTPPPDITIPMTDSPSPPAPLKKEKAKGERVIEVSSFPHIGEHLPGRMPSQDSAPGAPPLELEPPFSLMSPPRPTKQAAMKK